MHRRRCSGRRRRGGLEDGPTLKTAGKLSRLKDAAEKGKANTSAILKDYLETFAESLEDFRIDGTAAKPARGKECELIVKQVENFRAYRDQFVDFAILF